MPANEEIYRKIALDITKWYRAKGRDLPWRHTKDPYKIWVSEIMLQQTQVDTVIPYYERFLDRLPAVRDLAEAEEETILKLWEGLGYYRRAANMQFAARQIMEMFDGKMPDTYEGLLGLKGVGEYTASAISSIAYGIKEGVVDGNILRILSRLFDLDNNIADDAVKKKYKRMMNAMILYEDASDFNQGMMDLGATICSPKSPYCQGCPLQSCCDARKAGRESLLPVNIKKLKKTQQQLITAILQYEDQIFFVRSEQGLLQGLYGLPQYECEKPSGFEEAFENEYNAAVRLRSFAGEYKHVFTHKTWIMYVYEGELLEKPEGGSLIAAGSIKDIPIPTAHLKILKKQAYGRTMT